MLCSTISAFTHVFDGISAFTHVFDGISAFTRVLDGISAFTRVFDGMRVRPLKGGAGCRATGAAPAQARDRLRQDSFLAFRTCRPLYMPVFKSR
jgi:hypothetical protein